MRKRERSLAGLLLWRMALVAAGLTIALTGLVVADYASDTDQMRALTAERVAQRLALVLSDGHALPQGGYWQAYPRAYGWRVLDRTDGRASTVLASRNRELFPAEADTPVVGSLLTTAADGERTVFTLRGREKAARRWVQVVVADDPALLWVRTLGRELSDHVLMPLLLLVPVLTLAIWLVTRHALAPLQAVADAAAEQREGAGLRLRALPRVGLPREIGVVVDALNGMLSRLEMALAGLRGFAAEAAHELRTPLAVLRLEADSLPAGAVRARMVAQIDALATRVDAMLRVAEAEERAAGPRERFDLVALARGVCVEMVPLAAAGQCQLGFTAETAEATTLGHPALVEIALRNLVDNALRAAGPGGQVEVAVDAAGVLSVSDDGAGVPEEQREAIFERYRRGAGGGAGVGLSLVRRIALLHGGAVAVSGRQGGGARFELRLAAAAK